MEKKQRLEQNTAQGAKRQDKEERGKFVREVVSERDGVRMMDMFALPYTAGAKQTTAGWRWNLKEEMDGRTRGST
jgi:hypothetical protein